MEELLKLGYILSFSEACPIVSWGKWHVSLYIPNGGRVAGYGDDEKQALDQALQQVLKTARLIEENKGLTKH
jgi:hypothetical protein